MNIINTNNIYSRTCCMYYVRIEYDTEQCIHRKWTERVCAFVKLAMTIGALFICAWWCWVLTTTNMHAESGSKCMTTPTLAGTDTASSRAHDSHKVVCARVCVIGVEQTLCRVCPVCMCAMWIMLRRHMCVYIIRSTHSNNNWMRRDAYRDASSTANKRRRRKHASSPQATRTKRTRKIVSVCSVFTFFAN